MTKFVIYYFSVVLAVDAVLMGIYLNSFFYLLLVGSGLLIYLAMKLKTSKKIKVDDGLDLGWGIDLMDGLKRKVRVVLERKGLDLGFLFIGGPGAGKTIAAVDLLIYYVKRGLGWFYFEGKGDLDIYQTCVAGGAKPDFFFSSDLKYSDTTNVVSGPTADVVEALTQTLITSENEYYRTAQRDALGAVVPLLKACGKPIVLRDIYVCLKVDEAAQYVMKLAKENGVAGEVIEVARQFFEKDPQQRANDVNGMISKMSLFVTGDIAERINAYEPTLDLSAVVKNGQKVYFHMPYSSISKDIAIFFTEQIGVIAKNRQLYEKSRNVFGMLFDDWGKFFYPNIGAITARSRSAKMVPSYMFQSRGQTDAIDHARAFTIEVTDNIGGFCALRINGQESAKWVAEQFGSYETTEVSKGAYGETVSTIEKPRVRPDSLKDMNAGEAIIDYLVAGPGGASENRKVKARFPFPEMLVDPKTVDWPVIEPKGNNNDAEGLHLWRDFMNRDRLEALKKEVINKALADDTPANDVNDDSETQEINFL